MPTYSAISIIYNPNSTGRSKEAAAKLKQQLAELQIGIPVKLIPTEWAGHAEALAYKLAKAGDRALIISSSGDGGYNEVVNGIKRAENDGVKPVAALLPAGNANDHYNNLPPHDLPQSIVGHKVQSIDLLKISYIDDGEPRERYAHSYIGLGLTPEASIELNRHKLNRINEVWIIARVLFTVHAVRLKVRGKVQAYNSLVFSNVPRMSKYLSLSHIADMQDGKFEITAFRRRNKLHLIAMLLTASTRGLRGRRQATSFSFRTIKATHIQLDGEVIMADADTGVSVSIEPRSLKCIV